MIVYKYVCPTAKGYRKVSIPKELHKKWFKYEPFDFRVKHEYYWSEEKGMIHQRITSTLGIVVATLLFPLVLLIEGFGNFKDVKRTYYRLYNEKKTGSFCANDVSPHSRDYEEMKEYFKKMESGSNG